MGLIHRGIPQKIALQLKARYNLNSFVETGTLAGKTANWAGDHFEQVYSIELNPDLWEQVRKKPHKENVHFLQGDSREVLLYVLTLVKPPSLIWLDAHWSKDLGYARPKLGECPIIEELEQINRHGHRHVIMIDDARLFSQSPPKPHRADDWPSMYSLTWMLNPVEISRIIIVKDDVIIATPGKKENGVYL